MEKNERRLIDLYFGPLKRIPTTLGNIQYKILLALKHVAAQEGGETGCERINIVERD